MNAQTGTLVLIGPNSFITEGRVAVLGKPYLYMDQYSVKFNEIGDVLMYTKNLLVMKPHSELFRDILTIGKELSKEDFKLALQANVMQENGGPVMQKFALELLQGNLAAIEFATRTLYEKIELEIGREQGQKYFGGHQR